MPHSDHWPIFSATLAYIIASKTDTRVCHTHTDTCVSLPQALEKTEDGCLAVAIYRWDFGVLIQLRTLSYDRQTLTPGQITGNEIRNFDLQYTPYK